jgi:hypothetical protein
MITTIKKAGIIIVCLLFAVAQAAGNLPTLNEQTDSWLESSSLRSGYSGDDGDDGGLTGGKGATGNDPTAPGPVGDAFPLILLLTGIYGVYVVRKRKQLP